MSHKCCVLLLTTLLLVLTVKSSQVHLREESGVKSAVYLSPMFVMGAGSVVGKIYQNIDFPKGHIAVKFFNAEVVDEVGNPVPLHETYLHHWLTGRYYALTNENGDRELKTIELPNSGLCLNFLTQYFGLGSETRKTYTHVPDHYGLEVGNPADIPHGYVERWYLNVHAIDTRGVVDRMGCTECRCYLYNVTKPYIGGVDCCHHQAQCRLKEGFESKKRNLYMRYTVKWVDWVDTIVPIKIYLLDVADNRGIPEKSNESVGLSAARGCQVEYDVEACDISGVSTNKCLDNKRTNIVMPEGGYVIYAVAHQHAGGIGATLYGEDGRTICTSMPIYGEGKEVGNEAGYIVEMNPCYPRPGSVKISKGETLILESNYSSSQMHTAVMGVFYLWLVDQPSNVTLQSEQLDMQDNTNFPTYSWALIFIGVAIVVVAVISYRRRNGTEKGYRSIFV